MEEKGVVIKRGLWTKKEDRKLVAYIRAHGCGNWREVAAKSGLRRCKKSCRLRWMNYLRPEVKRGDFTPEEEKEILRLHALFGNRWSMIAANLPRRTDNEIKNYWNTRLKKRLLRMGIDPVTHRPKEEEEEAIDKFGWRQTARVNHITQWEIVRIQTESRLISGSKISSMLHSQWNSNTRGRLADRPSFRCMDVLQAWHTMNLHTSQATPMSLEMQNLTSSFSKNNSSSVETGADFGIEGAQGSGSALYSSDFDSNGDFNFMAEGNGDHWFPELLDELNDSNLLDSLAAPAVGNNLVLGHSPAMQLDHGISTTPN